MTNQKNSKDTEKNTAPNNATPTGMLKVPDGSVIPILGEVDEKGDIQWGKDSRNR